ncbi:23S rRNA (guanosine(2251)-2'-O)-methyltransferase RlmB [Nakamurella endophytica]|uniref:23S rRNA (Guanosine(2251)-2'-O)-methyltransferase RlmB n=2 Tax=Nakamurella endophytica TaxID=1748367 RepID=A0A917WLX4_9ACTN|nr:23S rRNA (guanosine(2251)-2'-O)-methyltransferase RlmB [Nakamurella endophytica]
MEGGTVMAGNSQRRGAVRKTGTKKGAVVGSGGQARRGLRGKGPTPPAEARKGHPAARRAAAAARRDAAPAGGQRRDRGDLPETVVGRNPVVEALRAGVPATALYVATGLATDERVTEAVNAVAERGIALLEVSRAELDRLTGGAVHQGLALQVPPYDYAHPEDLLARARDSGRPALVVAVDGVTDPRNLGAIVRSAAAFGAHGVLVPERRSAGMTASAWRTSAGTAARLRVARCTNLVRTLKEYAEAGLMIAGLDADGTVDTDAFELATGPLVLVVGSEGRGLSRLTRTVCDVTVSIPMARQVESLNASVAAGVVLAEVARRRRVAQAG